MTVRIAGVNLPNEKRIIIALTYIHGIGATTAASIMKAAKLDISRRTGDLTEAEVNNLREVVEKGRVLEGDLRREKASNIKRLKEINAYRGIRHEKHLPARGQSTKNNSRTVRGNKRQTAGSGRVKAGQKT